jgi:hypothetical protein
MKRLIFYSQYRENYGTPENPHWKCKLGGDYYVEVDDEIMPGEVFELFRKAKEIIDYKNSLSEEYLLNYYFAEYTEYEAQQLKESGIITDPAIKLELEGG